MKIALAYIAVLFLAPGLSAVVLGPILATTVYIKNRVLYHISRLAISCIGGALALWIAVFFFRFLKLTPGTTLALFVLFIYVAFDTRRVFKAQENLLMVNVSEFIGDIAGVCITWGFLSR